MYNDEDSVHVLDVSNMAAPLLGNHEEGYEMQAIQKDNAKGGNAGVKEAIKKQSEGMFHMDRETKQREVRAYVKVMGEKNESDSDENMLPFNIGALPGAIVGTVGAVVKTTTGMMGVGSQKNDHGKGGVLDNSSDDDI